MELVFPPICVDCGLRMAEPSQPWLLCRSCRELIQTDAELPACPGCGLPRPAAPVSRVICLECRRQRFRFNRVVALGLYRSHLRQVVVRMKQFHEFSLTAAVGMLLVDRLERQLGASLPPVIVPIPKFWVKRVLRGTNTAEVLAETIARHPSHPTVLPALRCRKPTRKQSLLGKTERQRNLSGALQLVKGYDVDGADVLIVDDIMTTGATANEAARVLSRAGARSITVAVVARAARGREFPRPSAGHSTAKSPGHGPEVFGGSSRVE
jgi:ComF family protein